LRRRRYHGPEKDCEDAPEREPQICQSPLSASHKVLFSAPLVEAQREFYYTRPDDDCSADSNLQLNHSTQALNSSIIVALV
jgi:hypothetical protein